MCHVSCVMCFESCVTSPMLHVILLEEEKNLKKEYGQTVRAEMLTEGPPPPTWHVSSVMCHVSNIPPPPHGE